MCNLSQCDKFRGRVCCIVKRTDYSIPINKPLRKNGARNFGNGWGIYSTEFFFISIVQLSETEMFSVIGLFSLVNDTSQRYVFPSFDSK